MQRPQTDDDSEPQHSSLHLPMILETSPFSAATPENWLESSKQFQSAPHHFGWDFRAHRAHCPLPICLLWRHRVHVEHGFDPRRFDTVAKSAPAQKWGSIPAGQNDNSDENRKGTGFRLQKSVSSCRILSAPRITSWHFQHFDHFKNRLAQQWPGDIWGYHPGEM